MKSLLFSLLILMCLQVWSANATVTLNVTAPANTPADSILSLGGDFNGWNPRDSDYRLEKVGLFQYRYVFNNVDKGKVLNFKVTRGHWDSVEINENGSNRENRRIVVTGAEQNVNIEVADWADLSTREAPSTIVGTVVNRKVAIPTFDTQRTIRIFLPPKYATSQARYPVIYMTDAQNLYDQKTATSGEWQMDELMEKLSKTGSHLTSIVVGIDHAGANRRAEYLPFNFKPSGLQSIFEQTLKGKGDVYADWLVNELKPYIDKEFRTKPEREHTSMLGSSMGGLITCYTALKHQAVISKAGCYSSAFLKYLVADNMVHFAQNAKKLFPMKIHIDMGDNEFGLFGENILLETEEVYSSILAAGFNPDEVRYQVIKGGTHDEPSWRDRTLDILLWLNAR